MADLDLKSAPRRGEEKLSLETADQHSSLWASIAKPFAQFIFGLVAAVIIIPFVLLWWIDCGIEAKDKVVSILDWAKTVFPPVVGFGSAVVGYYFGTRGSAKQADTKNNDS